MALSSSPSARRRRLWRASFANLTIDAGVVPVPSQNGGGGSGGGETFVLKSDRVHAKVGGGRLHDEIWAKHVIDYFRHVAKASKCDSDNSKSTMFLFTSS